MSFTDLPADWPQRPLSDPLLAADVLDLVVSERDRRKGALCVLLCRRDDRLLQPCLISDDGTRLEPTPREILEAVVSVQEDVEPDGSLIVAIARAQGSRPTDDDRRWHQAAIDACRGRARLLGVYVVTMDGSRRLPDEPLPERLAG